MARFLFPLLWRLMLAISLAVAPWPPATWAAVMPAPAADDMRDCHREMAHDGGVARQAADRDCKDDCCASPACDAAHCLVIHATIAAPAFAMVAMAPPSTLQCTAVDESHTGPPLRSPLRPPIA
jgi:hypothetical protein